MFLIKVVPLTNIPRPNSQEISFFSSRKLNIGSLTEIKMRNKKYPGLVLYCDTIKHQKTALRGASFALKPIEYSIIDEPVLFLYQIELAKWISEYYFTSLGIVLKKFVPLYLIKNPDKFVFKNFKFTIGRSTSNSKNTEQVLYLYPMKYVRNLNSESEIELSSRLSLKKEFDLFSKIKNGEISEIRGVKSALFAPYNNLKKIVIYEELDQSHISWDQKPHYNAIKVAKKLAKLTGAIIENKSSLPCLSSYLAIGNSLLNNQKNNNVKLVDLQNLSYGDIFTKNIFDVLRKNYQEKKSTLIYINRKGHSRLVVCRDCGFMPQCINCSITLTYHIFRKQSFLVKTIKPYLLCHYCLYKTDVPKICDKCGYHNLGLFGFGAQQVEQKLKELFSEAKILYIDSETKTANNEQGIMNNKHFIIATSAIFKFKDLKFYTVVALAPDLELNFPDYNASLNTFFNLWRLKKLAKNDFLIQTYIKENIVYNALEKNNYKLFYDNELKERKALNYPPFIEMIKLTFSHKSQKKALNEAKILHKKLEYIKDKKKLNTKIFDFMPALIYKLKGKFRYEIIIKIGNKNVKKYLLQFIPFNWEVDILE